MQPAYHLDLMKVCWGGVCLLESRQLSKTCHLPFALEFQVALGHLFLPGIQEFLGCHGYPGYLVPLEVLVPQAPPMGKTYFQCEEVLYRENTFHLFISSLPSFIKNDSLCKLPTSSRQSSFSILLPPIYFGLFYNFLDLVQ